MIYFFGNVSSNVFAVESKGKLKASSLDKLEWLFSGESLISRKVIKGIFIGPRSTMVTPWSTNAVEMSQNMGISGVSRIENFISKSKGDKFDKMLSKEYSVLDQNIFDVNIKPELIKHIDNISKYNEDEGLAINIEEIKYLENLSKKLKRKLSDSEVFGFSQVNSEHCRHKIFNGNFILNKKNQKKSLFELIKTTSNKNKNSIVSAYKDNVAFISGPEIEQFSPSKAEVPSNFEIKKIKSVISLKAETHNFPTTVEPFNGAATGSGGEIRDRMAGGQGSIPLAGTAVYMTPYSRIQKKSPWSDNLKERKWLYQNPLDILIKASNGASDFGNKFGQPLISGSLFTFEHTENDHSLGYDKVIMLAGGIGYANIDHAIKKKPKKGDLIVVLGGDNYRIGMGGASVSSSNTGEFNSIIELNAVQRSNPEMQKRVANTIRAFAESDKNPIISIHDHGAGGHLNCLSELVEETGGEIYIDKLPIGDTTLSDKEIIGNESQERMGLIISEKNFKKLDLIAKRERAPIYVVGKIKDDKKFVFKNNVSGNKPIDLKLKHLFGDTPKTKIIDSKRKFNYRKVSYNFSKIEIYLKMILQLESVACKDWLTNKVDRCVTGRVAQQQTVGELQLPLSNCGVISLDYSGKSGIATAIGHSPLIGLIDAGKGSINSIAESLTNIIWAPLKDGIKSISLSANWMWPCNNPGEDYRLYQAVKACSKFAINLGINIPTGKDSLSMKQQYKNESVISPGTVIISSSGHCDEITKVVTPNICLDGGHLYYLNLSFEKHVLGGSSLGQVLNQIGYNAPGISNSDKFKTAFNAIQKLIKESKISAGHDISSGGMIVSLLEMCFPTKKIGMDINLSNIENDDIVSLLFSENSGIIVQSNENIELIFKKLDIKFHLIGKTNNSGYLKIKKNEFNLSLNIDKYRDIWFKTSFEFDKFQTKNNLAKKRFNNYKHNPLEFVFPKKFNGSMPSKKIKKIKAAVIREKGSNSEREMAYVMHICGFEVYDVHMTDLISGRTNLEDFHFLVAVGGFSNSDVLGSAKGWAGSFLYNKKAKKSLEDFFKRKDTLSLGVCNGCQLFIELGLITPEDSKLPKMMINDSGKFECVFTSVKIQKSSSIMLKGMEGSVLGIWAAHGEGKFCLPYKEKKYQIPAKYYYNSYPSNPNGSNYNSAMLCSENGRHLVMMPHLERSTFPWNWAYYPKNREDKTSPWLMAFENAFSWLSYH